MLAVGVEQLGLVVATFVIAIAGAQVPGIKNARLVAQVFPDGQHAAYKVVPAGQAEPAGSYTNGEPEPTWVPPVAAVHQVTFEPLPQALVRVDV